MSEVEKMYENAGVEPKAKCTSQACIVTNPHKNWCNKCESLDYDYPPFTAEKQLWLIKWLSDIDEYVDIHYDRYKGLFEIQTGSGGLCVCNDFEDALASRVNMIWQDLTESEQEQIRMILKG